MEKAGLTEEQSEERYKKIMKAMHRPIMQPKRCIKKRKVKVGHTRPIVSWYDEETKAGDKA